MDDLKQSMSEQAEFNRKEFESLDDHQRLVYEGVRPGSYVRLEIKVHFIHLPFSRLVW